MRKISTALTALFITVTGYSQTCDCKAAFDFTVQKIETNYPGFRDKVTSAKQAVYNAYTDSLRSLATSITYQKEDSCYSLLTGWLSFLKDGHTYINFLRNIPTNGTPDVIRQQYANWPSINHTASSFASYLASNKKSLKPLEGIWQLEGGNYTVGIIYKGGKYSAFILKADSLYWMPQQVKFEIVPKGKNYEGTFYLRNHAAEPAIYDLTHVKDGYMQTGIRGTWYKLNESGERQFKDYYSGFGIVSLKSLSPKTKLLTIKSFDGNYRQLIDSLLTANDSLLRHTDNLIIDVRGNGGGSDYSYYPLRKYLYTHSYTRYGMEVYTTKDNIDKFKALITNPTIKKDEQEDYRKRVEEMEKHPNTYWSRGQSIYFSDTLNVLPYPKRIAVVIDGNCASSTEQFLFDVVRNSTKATIYGQPSAGILDYGNLHWLPIPQTSFELHYPTTRSKRVDMGLGIDNKGIQPHVKLGNTTKDWIKYVQQEMEKK